MTPIKLEDVSRYVENNIGKFHQKRLAKVNSIALKEVLKSKNPYLFKAKNVTTASEIIEGILSAFLSSSEEGIFGNWLERLAIYVNDSVFADAREPEKESTLTLIKTTTDTSLQLSLARIGAMIVSLRSSRINLIRLKKD